MNVRGVEGKGKNGKKKREGGRGGRLARWREKNGHSEVGAMQP